MKKMYLVALACAVLGSCHKNNEMGENDILYIQTNDYRTNQNAILAYHIVGNGKLEQFGGAIPTRGSGVGDPMQKLGPLDSDFELQLSSDGKRLMAVNSGSNTIAVFDIKSNGKLEHVPGSPFPSGGQTPVSIDVSGNKVFVVNKSDDPLHTIMQAPNYTTFTMGTNGALTPVAGAKFETARGTSPSQALVSNDNKFVFGDDFLGFMHMPPLGTLRSFTKNASGMLNPVAGTPYFVPGNDEGMNGALGLWQHPSANVLYVGFPLLKQVAVYAINSNTGALPLQTTVPAGTAACWIRTNKAGTRMYVLNSGDNTVQVYNISNPSSPVSMQTLELKNSGPVYEGPGGIPLKTSEPFSLAFSTDEKILYIVNQHTNPDFSIGNYNYLHYLKVNTNGTLAENSEPVQIPVPNTVRPKGSVVVRM